VEDLGLHYLEVAAARGDVAAMAYLGQAYDTGLNLGTARTQSYSQAVQWYLAAGRGGVEGGCSLLGRAAELLAMEGPGCFDPALAAETFEEAAEAAMGEMKGKLATRFYCKAEEAWALVP